MTPMIKTKILTYISVLAIVPVLAIFATTSVKAGDYKANYQANFVELSHFIGRVEVVTTATDDVRLEVDAGDGVRDLPQVRLENGVLKIFYKNKAKVRQCNASEGKGGAAKSVSIKLKGQPKHKLAAYPSLRLEVPAGTDFSSRGGVIFGSAGDLNMVDFTINGCGNFRLGNVSGDLRACINGSGDITARDVVGALDAGVNGSGDIAVGVVGGSAALRINGSGDIAIASVTSLDASINGSGDIEVGATNGKVDLSVNGSGDIEVRSGIAAPFEASIRGSGDIAFEGHAKNVKVHISGSGDVVVGSFEGSVDTSGHGVKIKINDGRLHVEG